MSRVSGLNPFEREARRRWRSNAAHEHFGRCSSCSRTEEHDGSPLYVARQPRKKYFECLECFEFGPGSGRTTSAVAAEPLQNPKPWEMCR